jgi:hypothetical protein
MIELVKRLSAVAVCSSVALSAGLANAAPTNQELYDMLLATQKKMEALQSRAEKAEAEVKKANAEAEMARREAEKASSTAAKAQTTAAGAQTTAAKAGSGGGFGAKPKITSKHGLYTSFSASMKKVIFEEMTLVKDTENNKDYALTHTVALSPEVVIGYETKNGLGVKARLSYLHSKGSMSITEEPGMSLRSDWDNDRDDVDIAVNQGEAFKAKDNLYILDSDVEAYKAFGTTDFAFVPRAGIRYVNMLHKTKLWETGGNNETINMSHSIKGAGPKIGLDSKIALSHNVWLTIGGATSLIVASERSTILGERGVGIDYAEKAQTAKLLPIYEMNVGVEWSPKVNVFDSLTISTVVEGEYWNGGGGWNTTINDGGAQHPDVFSWGSIGGRIAVTADF